MTLLLENLVLYKLTNEFSTKVMDCEYVTLLLPPVDYRYRSLDQLSVPITPTASNTTLRY